MENIKKFKALTVVLALVVFITQPFKVGFEKGHHGWVSADGLSIISRANLDHYFVGLVQESVTPEGKDYYYFDRYPPFFSASMNTLLKPFEWNLPAYIYSARTLMNLIFVITFWFGFKFLCFFLPAARAFALALIVFSGHFFIHYKDMVHFDQPAILGNLILMWAIAEFKFHQRKKLLYTAAIIAPLWGRGYSSGFLLLTWNLFEFLYLYKMSFLQKIRLHLRSIPFIAMLICVPLTAGSLGYNIWVESQIREVSIKETSIVNSMTRRLGVKSLAAEQEKKAKWSSFIPKQIDRQKDLLAPEVLSMFDIGRKKVSASWEYYLRRLPAEVFAFTIVVLFLFSFKRYLKSLDDKRKILYLSAFFFGFVWNYTMKKLATYHDYTTLYYWGFAMMVYLSLAETHLKSFSSKKFMIIGWLIFLSSLGANFYKAYPHMIKNNHQAYDFNQIRQNLKSIPGEPVFKTVGPLPHEGHTFINGSPYAPYFFLTGYFFAKDGADYDAAIKWENGRIILEPTYAD